MAKQHTCNVVLGDGLWQLLSKSFDLACTNTYIVHKEETKCKLFSSITLSLSEIEVSPLLPVTASKAGYVV